ncbi:MAG: CBS domain-containing protein [Desulfuromonadaceae bacterium]|nr:CBS domain-containing protein [Desulfuromonadaceae bacterium]
MNQQLIVANYMDKRNLTLRPDMPITQAMDIFLKHRLLAAFVIDERGAPIGLLSENDCLKVLLQQTYYQQDPEDTVATYMCEPPMPITGGTTIVEAARLFLNSKHRHLPVVEGGHIVGQISRREIIRAMHRSFFFDQREKPAEN